MLVLLEAIVEQRERSNHHERERRTEHGNQSARELASPLARIDLHALGGEPRQWTRIGAHETPRPDSGSSAGSARSATRSCLNERAAT